MYFCQVQRFIGVDISQSSQEGLVEQQGFQLTAMGIQPAVEFLVGEILSQGLWTQVHKNGLRIGEQPNAPNLAGVVECQPQIAIEIQH